jgi:hypothetical protein
LVLLEEKNVFFKINLINITFLYFSIDNYYKRYLIFLIINYLEKKKIILINQKIYSSKSKKKMKKGGRAKQTALMNAQLDVKNQSFGKK